MKTALTLAVAAVALFTAPVQATEAPAIKANLMVKTADGARVGRVDRVITDASGAPVSVKIIYRGRFVTIPAETLTAADAGLVTSLNRADVNKL